MHRYSGIGDSTHRLHSSRPSYAYIYAPVNYAIIGSDYGLSPVRRQAIIWTNEAGLRIYAPVN